jgi:hypothetical protein
MRIRSGNLQTEGVDTLEVPADWVVTQPDRGHVSLALNGSQAVKFTITTDGTTYYARDSTGFVIASGTDPAALLTAQLPAASSSGGEYAFGPGVFTWGSIPALPKAITRRLKIRGTPDTLISLTAGAPRFLDFGRTGTTSIGSQTLPQGTFNVASTTGFPASGTIQVATGSGNLATTELIAYTGLTATSFTGCTTTSVATITAGAAVQLAYETFQNIDVEDFLVDAQSVGGRHHVLLGTYVNARHEYRMNVDQLNLRRLKAINVLTDSNVGTNNRVGIYIVVGQAAASEAIQSTLTRINIEDVRLEGGNYGFTIGGTGITTSGLNVFHDEIRLRRCWHSLMSLQASGFSSANYFIGSRGFGGRCTITDCYGQWSADVGIEIDAMSDATVTRCTIDDARNSCFFHTNFTTPSSPLSQTIRFVDSLARYTSTPAGGGHGFMFSTAGITGSAIPLGTQYIRGCTVLHSYTGAPPAAFGLYRTDAATPPGTFNTRLVIRDLTIALENWNYSAGGSPFVYPFRFGPSAGAYNTLDVDGLHFKFNGTVTNGPTLTIPCLDLTGVNLDLDLRNVDVDANGLTGVNTNCLRICELGTTTATTTVGMAKFRGFRWINAGGATAPFGIIVRATGTLTLASGVRIEGSDFSQQAGGTDLSIDATQKAKVFARGNTYHAVPAPTTLTGLSTGVGKQLATGWDSIATFTQGSGTAITAIDYSTNGGTTYTNFLTQASGALPAGFSQSLGPLPPDALIKVTFTGTQPTINLAPVNP